MRRLALFALAALCSVALYAQDECLGMKFGKYEVKLGKGKWGYPVTAIFDNETGAWVTSQKIDKKTAALWMTTKTDVKYIEGDRYVPEAQGLLELTNAARYGKGVDAPNNNWICFHHGVYRIENDKLVPIVESGDLLEYAYRWEARYAAFSVVPKHALIIGVYKKSEKEGYSVFNLDGERIYDNLKDFKYKDEPTLKIQLEDGSWHHLDPADGHILD